MIYLADSITNLNTYVLIGVALVVGLFTLIRGRADVWKSNYEGEKERADNLQTDKNTMGQTIASLNEKIIKLESAPNVDKLFEMMQHHDNNAARRNEQVVKVLKKIVENQDRTAEKLAKK
ncbi:MAG: hypothetical protein EPO02_13555 [Nitrospirae bacterium]|nr:MAG: hypothetical protein EPO02_13555 [Nitrospirota bacterium]